MLYVTGEESAAQVKLRADRIHAVADTLYLTSETDLGTALAHIEQVDPAMLVIDSVQTLASADVEGSAGGVTQVREVAASLIATAKARNMCTLLVGACDQGRHDRRAATAGTPGRCGVPVRGR